MGGGMLAWLGLTLACSKRWKSWTSSHATGVRLCEIFKWLVCVAAVHILAVESRFHPNATCRHMHDGIDSAVTRCSVSLLAVDDDLICSVDWSSTNWFTLDSVLMPVHRSAVAGHSPQPVNYRDTYWGTLANVSGRVLTNGVAELSLAWSTFEATCQHIVITGHTLALYQVISYCIFRVELLRQLHCRQLLTHCF